MRIPDANVLLHCVNSAAPQHATAKRWIESALSGTDPVGFAWVAVLAFIRLSTRRGVFPTPLTLDEVTSVVSAWLSRANALVVAPTDRHLDLLRGLLGPLGTAANLVSDAHLAVLALEHGATVATFDRDFTRFVGLRVEILA